MNATHNANGATGLEPTMTGAVAIEVDTGDPAEVPGDTSVVDEVREPTADEVPTAVPARDRWTRVVAYGLLPAVALTLTVAAGYLKWQSGSAREAQTAAQQSMHAAADGTIAILSYKPDTVDKDLGAATDRLTGDFKNTYTSLTRDVVIPGAKQKQITEIAKVPAAGSVSATENHAVVLVFVNQTTSIGGTAPTNTASSVRVTLDKVDGRWLIAQFDPV
jgi:Mce-associated membrane protein